MSQPAADARSAPRLMSPARFTMEERRVMHAAELFEALGDPQLYKFLDEAPPKSVEELATKLEQSEGRRSPDGREHWLNWVVRAESGELAGYVQATVEESKETNVAYVFSSRFQGQGIASAAVRQMIETVWAKYHATTMFIVTEAANLPSLRLAKRLGFSAVPRDVADKRHAGPSDVVLWLKASASEA